MCPNRKGSNMPKFRFQFFQRPSLISLLIMTAAGRKGIWDQCVFNLKNRLFGWSLISCTFFFHNLAHSCTAVFYPFILEWQYTLSKDESVIVSDSQWLWLALLDALGRMSFTVILQGLTLPVMASPSPARAFDFDYRSPARVPRHVEITPGSPGVFFLWGQSISEAFIDYIGLIYWREWREQDFKYLQIFLHWHNKKLGLSKTA